MPVIDVSEYVKTELDEIKEEQEHKSYDSVLRTVLGAYER